MSKAGYTIIPIWKHITSPLTRHPANTTIPYDLPGYPFYRVETMTNYVTLFKYYEDIRSHPLSKI